MLLVAIWAFAEAIVFFVVADVPITWIGLKRGWRASSRAALVAALAAAAGGLVLMGAARAWPEATMTLIDHVPGISGDTMMRVRSDYIAEGWTTMMEGAFSGTPYKLYVLAAAQDGIGAAGFAFASIVARLPRFLIVAALSSGLGAVLRPRLSFRAIASLHLAFWSLFYVAYFAATGF